MSVEKLVKTYYMQKQIRRFSATKLKECVIYPDVNLQKCRICTVIYSDT